MSELVTHRLPGSRGAFTLVEAVVCTLVVAVLFVVAVQAVGLSATMQLRAADRTRARAMAFALLDEIVQQKYSSASMGGPVFDLLPGDHGTGGSRLGFDDVDDYRDYSEKPPEDRNGAKIPSASDYRRRVEVEFADPLDLSKPGAGDTGLKRVTVIVTRKDFPLARVSAVRANVP